MNTDVIPVRLDLRGLKCPYPVLKTEKRMSDLPAGALVDVETTDPLAGIDIPHFCNQNGHHLVSQETTPFGHRFVIRKAD